VTGRRQGPKRKLRAGFIECRHKNRRYVAIIFHRGVWYSALLCAMRVFEILASSSPPG